jgi:hypothetical protein
MIFCHGHRSLLESLKLLLFKLYESLRNMVRPETVSELLRSDGWSVVWASILIRLPPFLCGSLQLARSVQDLVKITALGYV